jgi:uncharacterized membrane protein YuzA (DUF378 family)
MNIKHHTHPDNLEKYSFVWSEARLVIAAVALFIGGYPPVLFFNPISSLSSVLSSLLKVAWIISGIASAYLLYRWMQSGKTLFGGKHSKDTWAFLIMIVTGFNLGLAGVLGTNIGMSITSSRVIFFIAGVLYLVTVFYLHQRWVKSGKKIFSSHS